MKQPVLILAVAALLPLAACSKKPETQAQAGGEILEGSISDAMLPLDTATSQPPLAPKAVNTGGTSGEDKDPDAGDKPDAPAAEPAPKAPAAEPE
jgi:hypothetical protein